MHSGTDDIFDDVNFPLTVEETTIYKHFNHLGQSTVDSFPRVQLLTRPSNEGRTGQTNEVSITEPATELIGTMVTVNYSEPRLAEPFRGLQRKILKRTTATPEIKMLKIHSTADVVDDQVGLLEPAGVVVVVDSS